MNRIDLINEIVLRNNKSTYLEIGVARGTTFFQIECENKVAVDPKFMFNGLKKLIWKYKNPTNKNNQYFNLTSDEFFTKEKDFLKNLNGIDVIFIDGLHTFENSLQDVLNSLKYLKKDGYIIMHDCFPPHEAAAMPTKTYPTVEQRKVEGWTGAWCGDVWKSIAYLKAHYQSELDISVLNTDFGLGVITVKNSIPTNLSIDENSFSTFNQMTYNEMKKNAEVILNLKNIDNKEATLNAILSKHKNQA